MKSLEERQAFREAQKRREAKEREHDPMSQEVGYDEKKALKDAADAKPVPEGDETGQLVNEVSGKNPDDFLKNRGDRKVGTDDKGTGEVDEFDAKDYVNDTVDSIKGDIGNLSPEQLTKVEAAERAGKNRASVNDAIAAERKKREQAAASWGANK